ncbi:unnamed protein product [Adineta steineri]|uniref:Uncharacterized protein n=1 Tax=Adineta steineri TaxID=433720 RepID=A0A815NSK5_9BILA|nr:unnamed protein product [Adineta steineri]CAF1416056.1 unnamed protein product [Adineta steineri]CAF1437476.1 unnamed protein product [Adineta steineri]
MGNNSITMTSANQYTINSNKCQSTFSSNKHSRTSPYNVIQSISKNYIIIGCISLFLHWVAWTSWMIAAERQIRRIRCKLFRNILYQEIGWFDTHNIGELNNRLNDDLVSPLIILMYKITIIIIVKYSVKEIEAYSLASSIAEEALGNIRTVTSFHGQQKEEERYSQNLFSAKHVGIRKSLYMGISQGLGQLLSFSAITLTFWYGLKLVQTESQHYTPGALFVILNSCLSVTTFSTQFIPCFNTFAEASASASFVFDMIERKSKVNVSDDEGKKPETIKGDIEFKNVKFSYPTRQESCILQNFSMKILSGKTIALVGASGCGKSTIIQLIQRFYDPDSGEILIDGHNIKTLNVAWLRSHIGIVSQEPVLFDGSIEENIRLGKLDATDQEVIAAAKLANAHNFIMDFPENYKTISGDRLSGGEKQRVVIARALISNPKILLLDEATSALDYRSERIVQDALDNAKQGRTTIVVAHRLSTIRDADAIIGLNDGQIVEYGTHDELMKNKGLYYGLVNEQGADKQYESSSETDTKEEAKIIQSYTQILSTIRNNIRELSDSIEEKETDDTATSSFDDYVEEKQKKQFHLLLMFQILKFNIPEWHWILIGSIASLLFGFIPPAYAYSVTGIYGSFAESNEDKQKRLMNFFTIGILFAGVVSGLSQFILNFSFGKSSEELTARIRRLTFSSLLRQEMSYYDMKENSVSVLNTRLASDVADIKGLTGIGIGILLQGLSTLAACFTIGFISDWKLALVLSPCIPIVFLSSRLQGQRQGDISKIQDKGSYSEQGGKCASEAIKHIRTVVALHQENHFINNYEQFFDQEFKVNMCRLHMIALGAAVANSLIFFIIAVTFSYGSVLVQKGEMTFQNVYRMFVVILIATEQIGQATGQNLDYSKARHAAMRILKLIKRTSQIDPYDDSGIILDKITGRIEFQHVYFRYPSRRNVQIFRDFSLTCVDNSSIALVGPSGSGKSTVIDLLQRIYDPLKGKILFDGHDIRTLNIQWFRSLMGVVQQEPVLFNISIRDNIAYGDNSRELSQDEIEKVAQIANIHDLIISLPQGYDTLCGYRGNQLSAGQKQRIAIARALIRSPNILLFDEATSALDNKSESKIQEVLENVRMNRTSLTIAHRLSTIQNSDKIFVIDKGQMKEEGTHNELLKSNGIYSKMSIVKDRSKKLSVIKSQRLLGNLKNTVNDPTLALANNTQSNTNLSRSVSLTILDRCRNETHLRTNLNEKIKLIIPHDPNKIIPSMTLQNVTSIQKNSHYQIFNFHFINLQQSQWNNNRSVSLIFEMKSLNINQSLANDKFYKCFLNNEQTLGHQSIKFGLRELNLTEYETFCITCCYYLNKNLIWKTDGILVGSETNHYQTQCFPNYLTIFAGGFLVLPLPINWNVFDNADFSRTKTIYLTIICICILYILIVIYARYKDKKDLEKLGVTPLSDNYSTDQYFYQMIVFTGHRANAGTNSKVHFILAGEEDETAVRTFSDPHRKILQRGGIDAFIMAVPKSLGLLNYMRIWHDNSGQHDKASWFLKYIIVRDLQTMEKSYFICQQWFAVEKNDGRIERILPIAGELQKHEFSYVLSKQAYHSITEGHLWFSIFSRPPSNKFTCVQRCTCCFVLLFTAMLLNILYYDQTNETNTNQTDGSLSFGPFYISSQQISIGIIVEILSFFPSLLLVQFFRRILPRQSIKSNKTKRSQLMFPWWCLFFAYSLSFILVLVSSFFIIVRGIQFGDLKTQKWLTSLLSGFFSSIFLIQPLKIVALAIFFAFFIRKSDKDNEAAEYLDDNVDLNHNEEYLHSRESPLTYCSQTRNVRLNESELACIRDQRLKEIRMWEIIREIVFYFFCLILIYLITYTNMNSNAFFQVNHLQKYFLNTNQIDNDYTKISTIDQYWNWLENSFILNIHAQQWYNGEAPENLNGFINDKSNRLIGRVLMRQLRVKTSLCPTKLSLKCNEDYSFFNEDKNSYTPGWLNQTNEYSNSSIIRAFLYDNGENYDQYIYIGKYGTYNSGGYIYEYQGRLSDIHSNLSELHRLSWIDSQTRAILLQLTLYNPNVQLFTSVKFLTEFLPTGGLLPQYRVEPITFQVFISSFQLICTIVYMFFIIYHMIIEIKSVLRIKLSYFYNFWSDIDIGIIGCSWGILGVYICRYQQTISIGNRFQQTNGYAYINLQVLICVNDILTYLLAFCCFFGTLKFLRLCRFHQRLLLFTKTLQYAKKDLFSFMFMFLFVFMAFLTLFYLLFSDKISSCSTLLHTAQTLFEMMLMKFDAYELTNAALMPEFIYFSLFFLFVIFICMSIFITIINDTFRIVRNNTKIKYNEDQTIFEFMLHKFQHWG